MSIERLIYIYTLSDPITKEIRYVGKTVQKPTYRLSQHISQSRCTNKKDYCHCWIKSLLNKDLEPVINIIEKTYDVNRECYWIKYYKDNNYKLTNLQEGGDKAGLGTKRTIEQIENIRKGRIKNSKFEICELNKDFKILKIWDSYSDLSIHLNLNLQDINSRIKRMHKIKNNYFILKKDLNDFLKDKLKIINIKDNTLKYFNSWKEFTIYFNCSNKIIENYLNINKLYLDKYLILKNKNYDFMS